MRKTRTDLLQGTLDLLILRTLGLGPLHGWGIAQRIQQISQDELRVEGLDEVQAPRIRQGAGVLESRLEVVALHDQLGPESLHGGVLLAAVSLRDHQGCAEAGAAGGIGDALAVVAAGRGDDSGDLRVLAAQLLHVDDAAAQLEGADGRVVLVLDPDLAAGAARQKRPAVLENSPEDKLGKEKNIKTPAPAKRNRI